MTPSPVEIGEGSETAAPSAHDLETAASPSLSSNELIQALRQHYWHNPLKLFIHREERRLHELFYTILQSIPPEVLNLQVGDLIRLVQSTTDGDSEGCPSSDLVDQARMVVSWVRTLLPRCSEEAGDSEDQTRENIESAQDPDDNNESFHETKRLRMQ